LNDPSSNLGLQAGCFRKVAESGIGDPGNSYPHAMCWFKDHLYVGTTRLVLTLLYNRYPELRAWSTFPVRTAKKNPYQEFDARGQLWRFHPPTNRWEKLKTADVITGKDELPVPKFQGVRNMVVFQPRGAKAPSMYTLTWSPQTGPGPMLLRTENGTDFEEIPMLGFAVTKYSTFRPLLEFKGRLFTAPTGRTGSANQAGAAIVLESFDPATDPWRETNEENFGDPHNETVFEMVVYNNRLYAGTMNPDGFQLWRTDAEGTPPYKWTRVLTRGAYRGMNNEGVGSLCVFNGSLYIGSVISNGGYDRKHGIGPAAVEIVRLNPDDSWDLVMGEGRVTPDGLKFPVSGLGPGFDKGFNAYLWRMCVHDGWLYAGTFAWSSLLLYAPREKWPAHIQAMMDPERTNTVLNKLGGFDLWRTRDGVFWVPVTRNGFGNSFNWGVRTMVSTDHGLFVGTANPFGPDINVERAAGWQFEPNAKGGLEIWLGAAGGAVPSNVGAQPPVVAKTELPSDCLKERASFIETMIGEFYGSTPDRSVGLWKNGAKDAADACRQLRAEVMSFVAPPETALVSIEELSRGTLALAEAKARMKPGGLFVGADVLSVNPAVPLAVHTAGELAALLGQHGFGDVRVVDVTEATWNLFRQKLKLFLWEKMIDYELDEAMVGDVERALFGSLEPVVGYAIFSARLPKT